MRVALTGAPGTGKTTLAALLDSSFSVHAVRDLAEACGALGPLEDDGAHGVDLHALLQHVQSLSSDVLIEGHLSHHLNPILLMVNNLLNPLHNTFLSIICNSNNLNT